MSIYPPTLSERSSVWGFSSYRISSVYLLLDEYSVLIQYILYYWNILSSYQRYRARKCAYGHLKLPETPVGPGWVLGGPGVGPGWVPGTWVPVGLFEKHHFFKPCFWYILAVGWLPSGSMFGDFSRCLASLCGAFHRFGHVVWRGLWCVFDDCPFAHSPYETLFFDHNIINLHDLTHPKNMLFHYLPHFFRNQYLHGSLMRVGIVIDSCWTPSGIVVLGFGRSFSLCFCTAAAHGW